MDKGASNRGFNKSGHTEFSASKKFGYDTMPESELKTIQDYNSVNIEIGSGGRALFGKKFSSKFKQPVKPKESNWKKEFAKIRDSKLSQRQKYADSKM